MRFLRCLVLCMVATWSMAATIVCLGDSLTAGYGLSESEAWPAILQQHLRTDAPQAVVLNAGRSGDTSAGGLRRLDWSLKAKPEIVIIALGANDGMRGLPLNDLEANLTAIVRRIQDSGAKAVLAGMQLPTNLGDDYRRDFAAIYPRICEATGATAIPFLLKDVAMEPDKNLPDRIHPNPLGHRIIAVTVAAVVKPMVATMQTAQP